MADGLSPKQTMKMSDLALGVSFHCKIKEKARMEAIVERLEDDAEVLYEELLLRKKYPEVVADFLKECEEFAS